MFQVNQNQLQYLNNQFSFSIDRIVWRGRLCIQNQSEYNTVMDHIIAEVNKIQCSTENCQLCQYRSMNEARINSELNGKNIFLIILLYL